MNAQTASTIQAQHVLSCVVEANFWLSRGYRGLLANLGFATLLLVSAPLLAAVAPSLGNAQSFAVLGASTVTNTGLSTITGDLGVSSVGAVTGFPPGVVSGTIHAGDATAIAAQGSVTTAYNDLSQVCTQDLTGQDLGGLTLTPGVYCFSATAQLTGILTLNAQGDANAVFVFRTGSTLTTASSSSVVMSNGGSTCNVFWQVGSSATLGTTTSFEGNILAQVSITLNTGATVKGRALARTGAVTLDTNTVSTTCVTTGCPNITLLAPPLLPGTVGIAYSRTITASGGVGTSTFSVTAGSLPTGMSLSGGGLISGTPTTAGTFTFTVTATDANGCTGLQTYTIVINAPACPSITLTSPPLSQGTVGIAYSQTVTASGGVGTSTFSVTAGSLPTGMSLSGGGLVSGTPTTAGTTTATVTATDANSCTGLQAYTIVINSPACPSITLSPPPLPQGTVGIAYNRTITASGGVGASTFSITAGSLPTGMSLSSGGIISGTPTTAGTFTFTVTATDANGCTGLQAYTMTITLAATSIPTLSEWAMAILAALLVIAGFAAMRRQAR